MKNLILITIITLPLSLYGQVQEQTFGGESTHKGYSVQQTTYGGYILKLIVLLKLTSLV